MIDVMEESNRNVLGFRATGKLSQTDYRDVLHPRIEKLLKRFPTLNVLFLMDDAFAGWSLAAAWANTIFDLKHRHDFDKIAMVGCPMWEEWCVKLAAAPLMGGKMRTFRPDELDQAWKWVQA
jgi:hypothetical protein